MILSDRDLKKRIIGLGDIGLTPDFLGNLHPGQCPKELDQALDEGSIVMHPLPADEQFDADTIDVSFGNLVEVPEMPLEEVKIDGRTVIRRLTRDFRVSIVQNRLDQRRKVEIVDHSRMKFMLTDEETIELQPGMMVLAHTFELICIPYDLQMQVGGRSKVSRWYVTAHVSSPVLHPGWFGHIVMEVQNNGDFNFNAYPKLPFAMVHFIQLSSKAERPYWKKAWAQFSGQR